MWHVCCKRWGGSNWCKVGTPEGWELLQLCFWVMGVHEKPWENGEGDHCGCRQMRLFVVFPLWWRLITCQTATECHSCLPVIFNLGANFGRIQQKTTQQFIWVAWHCRTPTLWFMMVIRRYNQWNKSALMPPALQKCVAVMHPLRLKL